MTLKTLTIRLIAIVLGPLGMFSLARGKTPDNIQFPDDAGVINVQTAYGAKGDGITDDTQAIQHAIDATKGQFRILYFPNGTYLISDKLTYGADLAISKANVLQGQSRAKTILKLADHAAGFGDPAVPKHLLSLFEGYSTGQAFHNSLYDLTIDTGSGNPGAIALEYIDNNQGGIFNVTIRSGDGSGVLGLDMLRRWPGPGLIQNVAISGFDVGCEVGQYEYSMAFSNLELSGQKVAGIRTSNNVVAIEGLKSTNSCPVVVQTDNLGMIVLVNSTFSGGASDQAAVVTPGPVYLQHVSQTGYGLMVKNAASNSPQMPPHQHGDLAASQVDVYSGHAGMTLGKSFVPPAPLPVEQAPLVPWDPVNQWVAVKGGNGEDDSPAIQAAIDEADQNGKTTVYFPGGKPEGYYKIGHTVRVHGSVTRIIGCESNLFLVPPLLKSTDPAFRFEDLRGPAVVFERFWMTPWEDNVPFPIRCPVFEDNDRSTTIILRNLMCTNDVFRTGPEGRGKVFVEDVTGRTWSFSNGQKVWARQFNPEGRKNDIPYVTCDQATFWCLDLKTEGHPVVIDAKNQSSINLLGGLIYPIGPGNSADTPMFVLDHSSANIVTAEATNDDANNYKVYVSEVIDGQPKLLDRSAGMWRGHGGFIPWYSSSP